MDAIPVTITRRGFGETTRQDVWWATPLAIFVGLSLFVVYATWAAFQNAHYTFGPYLSPFYSPDVGRSPHAWFGPKPGGGPASLPFSPALLILPFPGLFRFTCYYYRGAYYKSFWADPPACAVGEPRKGYWGEQRSRCLPEHPPLLHVDRGDLPVPALLRRVAGALVPEPDHRRTEFGIGLGTIVLAVNVVLLSCYTLGCHVMRHVVGGRRDEVSQASGLRRAYACSTALNYKHQLFAWMSLFSVAFADIYVRLLSMGVLVGRCGSSNTQLKVEGVKIT